MKNKQIYQLSKQFYDDYPQNRFPEIEQKQDRPYTILILKITDGIKIGVPFRSHIAHQNAYHFQTSKRSEISRSGLDFSKMIILDELKYIGETTQIDRDEFTEYKKNVATIQQAATKYLIEYCNHHKGVKKLGKNKYKNAYKYTTLQYFHRELGIE